MQSNIGRIIRRLLAFLLACVCVLVILLIFGAVRSQTRKKDVESWQGLEQDEAALYLRSPVTFNDVFESALDENNDGKIDFWAVAVRENSALSCMYYLTDTNTDGVGDEIKVSIRDDHTVYSETDDDLDGTVDRTFFTLHPANDTSRYYVYADLDLDGRVDMISEYSSGDKSRRIASKIVMTDALLKVLVEDEHNRLRKRILTLSGEERWVELREGNWQ